MEILQVYNIAVSKYKIKKFIIIAIYFPNKYNKRNLILVYIKRKIYIVNSLYAKMLIANNIIGFKNIRI